MNDLERAKMIFQKERCAFVIVRDARVIATGGREGIGELLDVVVEFGDALRGAALADKIVGKAVALVAAYAGITDVYTPLGSQAAQQVFLDHGIAFEADRVVPLIRNKRNDDMCPLEKLTMPLNAPNKAVSALREFVAQKRAVVTSIP